MLWSLWFLDWKEPKYNIYCMWFKEQDGLTAFIHDVKMNKPASILHHAYHSVAPYADIVKIEDDTLIIKRYTENNPVHISFKDFYNELAAYKLSAIGATIS